MAGPLQVRLLGPLDVSVGGTATGPEGSHRRSLFAILAVRANAVVSVDDLVEGLWGDRPPRSATGVVQTYVSTWRRALDDARRAPWWAVAPQPVDQLVHAHRLVGTDGEDREQRAAVRALRPDRRPAAGDLQGTQQADPERTGHRASSAD